MGDNKQLQLINQTKQDNKQSSITEIDFQ